MRTLRLCAAAAIAAIAMTAVVVPAASADPVAPATTVGDGPYATVGTYDTVCTADNAAAQATGLVPNQCVSMPAPLSGGYTDSWYCRAAGRKVVDSDGNVWWEWEVSGYVKTNDTRATYGSITCQMTQRHESVTGWGPLPGTVTVNGTVTTDDGDATICAYGWIAYTYGNQSRIRYVGNGPC